MVLAGCVWVKSESGPGVPCLVRGRLTTILVIPADFALAARRHAEGDKAPG